MENTTSIRIELGIEAQKIVQQLLLNNETIEKQITKGIQLALDEIAKDETQFVEGIKNTVLTKLQTLVHQAIFSYEVQTKINKAIADKIGNSIDTYASALAERVSTELNFKG